MDFSGGFESKDIVFTKNGNEIQSGGFSVNSLFLKLGISPLHTLVTKGGTKKKNDNEEETLSSIMYDGFAVPIGLLCEHNNRAKLDDEETDSYYDYMDGEDYDDDFHKNDDVISEDFYDKLLGVHSTTVDKPKKKMTRKMKSVASNNNNEPQEERRKKHKKTRRKVEK
jgi:hypothetical protein